MTTSPNYLLIREDADSCRYATILFSLVTAVSDFPVRSFSCLGKVANLAFLCYSFVTIPVPLDATRYALVMAYGNRETRKEPTTYNGSSPRPPYCPHEYRFFSMKWDKCIKCGGFRPHKSYVKSFQRGELRQQSWPKRRT